MHPCGSCGWSSQQGATVVSFISAGHFIMQLIVVCIFGHATEEISNEEKLQLGLSTDEGYYGLIASTVLMLLMSILLFVGVRYWSVCMILPWVVTTAIADVGYFVMVIATFFLSITDATNRILYLTAFIGSTFIFVIVTYLLWVVIYFLLEILAQPAERNMYHKFGDGPSKSKSRGTKPSKTRTVEEYPINKYLPQDSE